MIYIHSLIVVPEEEYCINESNAWKKLPIKCMSQEESDYDDRNEVTFTVSSPCWRSEGRYLN